MNNNMIDASSDTTNSIAAIIEAGVTRVGRYYNAHNSTALPTKCLTLQEAQSLCEVGLSLVVVYQQGQTSSADFSKEAGNTAAYNARKCATGIGQPKGTVIYFSVDFDATQSELNTCIIPFFQAVNDELREFKIGVYGSGLVCHTLFDKNLTSYCWLSQSSSFTDTDVVTTTGQYNILQKAPSDTIGNLSVDYNQAQGTNQDMGAFQIPLYYKVSVNSDSSLNMRSQPSVDSPIIASLPNDTKVTRIPSSAMPSMDSEWLYLAWASQQDTVYGYVSQQYLQLLNGASA